MHYVAVPADRDPQPVRNFGPTTDQLIVLGDWFRRMRAKLGPAGAVTAGAHKLARVLYTMIKTRTAFNPSKLGHPALIRQRKERSLRKQAALLGFTLQPADAGAVA